jgi:hypothetical protein
MEPGGSLLCSYLKDSQTREIFKERKIRVTWICLQGSSAIHNTAWYGADWGGRHAFSVVFYMGRAPNASISRTPQFQPNTAFSPGIRITTTRVLTLRKIPNARCMSRTRCVLWASHSPLSAATLSPEEKQPTTWKMKTAFQTLQCPSCY